MIPHRSLSRDTSENGVSSRVEACRKRLRMIRANHKSPIETVEPGEISVNCNFSRSEEIFPGQTGGAASAERQDEVGLT